MRSFLTEIGNMGFEAFLEQAPGNFDCSEGYGAILVHCKGGFGRSVVLSCILLIHMFDVPGRSVLGWSRIARPGAITTPEQEAFLCKLRGRADLQKRVGMLVEKPGINDASA